MPLKSTEGSPHPFLGWRVETPEGLALRSPLGMRRLAGHSRAGIEWQVVGPVLALRDHHSLRLFARHGDDLAPWLAACTPLELEAAFPVVAVAGAAPPPGAAPCAFHDPYADAGASARLDRDAVHLALPLEDGRSLPQAIVALRTAADDGSTAGLPLSTAVLAAARRWLIRVAGPDEPATLAAWLADRGHPELAEVAGEAEEAFGGLRSGDRITRYGGVQMVGRATAPGSVAEHPIQETPRGPALLVAVRDVDSRDTLVALAADRSMWHDGMGTETWIPASDSVETFVSRVALWGHDDAAPTHRVFGAAGRALAANLGLDHVPEASDSHATVYIGDGAVVHERRFPDRVVTRMRTFSPRAERAWRQVVG